MLDLVENWFEYGNANDDGYAADVYRRLRNEEMRMPKFTGLNIFNNQNMLDQRGRLVDWMHRSCVHCLLHPRTRKPVILSSITLHLAVYIFEIFIERVDCTIDTSRCYLAAIVSLRLAAKLEEQEVNTPSLQTLIQMLNVGSLLVDQLDVRRYARYERRLLRDIFGYRLMLPTAPHFVPFLLSIVDEEDDMTMIGGRIGSIMPSTFLSPRTTPTSSSTVYYGSPIINASLLQVHVEHFLSISLQAFELRTQPPSMIAAACVVCARRSVDLQPTWTMRLADVSGYSSEQMSPVVSCLLRYANADSMVRMPIEKTFCSPQSMNQSFCSTPPMMSHRNIQQQQQRLLAWSSTASTKDNNYRHNVIAQQSSSIMQSSEPMSIGNGDIYEQKSFVWIDNANNNNNHHHQQQQQRYNHIMPNCARSLYHQQSTAIAIDEQQQQQQHFSSTMNTSNGNSEDDQFSSAAAQLIDESLMPNDRFAQHVGEMRIDEGAESMLPNRIVTRSMTGHIKRRVWPGTIPSAVETRKKRKS